MPRRTSAAVKAEIQEIRGRYEQQLAAYEGREIPDDVAEQMDAWDIELKDKLEEYSEVAQREATARDNREAMQQIFAPNGGSQPTTDGDRRPGAKAKPTSLGEIVVSDAEFAAWHQQIAPGGRAPSRDRRIGVSPAVELNAYMDVEFRELLTGALVTGASPTSAGAFVVPDRTDIVVPAVREELTLLDLVTFLTTESDTVEFVRVVTETSAAAETAEATSLETGEKPQSDIDFEVESINVKSVPHWIPITKRSLADARQVQAIINAFLLFGLRQRLNTQILVGDGLGENFTGIAETAGIQTQAFDTDILRTARKARTLMRLNGGSAPTAYVMNPVDWEAFDLEQDAEQRYHFGGPTRLGTPVLWGVPVVESEQAAEGTAYLGDWRQAVVWDREQASIQMSDSHADFFIKNLVAILAELRAAFGVLRPSAFVEISLTGV